METITNRELILEIDGEGGGWNIYRLTFTVDGTVKFSSKSTSVFDREDLDMTEEEYTEFKNSETYFDSFEDFWTDFTRHRHWFRLYFQNIHADYEEFIKAALIKAGRSVD
jgi:hypothetical protein